MAHRKRVIAGTALCLAGFLSVMGLGDVEWQVTWHAMNMPGEFNVDCAIAQSTLPFLISRNWESDVLIDASLLAEEQDEGYGSDRIGFQAHCRFELAEAGQYRIAILANNGVALRVNGEIILQSWENVLPDGGGTRSLATAIQLEAGMHTFELWYYEWEGAALLHFDSNIQPLVPVGMEGERERDL